MGMFDASEPLIQALKPIGKTLMVDAEAMLHGRIQVADMDGVAGYVVAEVVGFAVGGAAFDAAPSHPHGKATRMVVATVVVGSQRSL